MPLATGSDTSVEQDTFVFPAASARERLWFLDELEPHQATYNMVSTARISTPLNREALEQSLNTLIQRHETMRTTFLILDGQPMQAVAPTLTLDLPLVDLQPQQQAEVLRFANQAAQQPFDQLQEPLLKLTLFKLDAQEYLLVLSVLLNLYGSSEVVLYRQQSLTMSELQEHLTKALPTYMVPSAFMLIEAFPLLPNGKVDRHALPVPDQAQILALSHASDGQSKKPSIRSIPRVAKRVSGTRENSTS